MIFKSKHFSMISDKKEIRFSTASSNRDSNRMCLLNNSNSSEKRKKKPTEKGMKRNSCLCNTQKLTDRPTTWIVCLASPFVFNFCWTIWFNMKVKTVVWWLTIAMINNVFQANLLTTSTFKDCHSACYFHQLHCRHKFSLKTVGIFF